MRRKLWITVMLTALVIGLAGCGVRETQKDTAEEKNKADAVIQNAGTSEEQQRMRLKAEIEPGVVLTEHCLYAEDEDSVIVQMDYEGNELNRVELEDMEYFQDLLCGSDKRIILSGYADEGSIDEGSVDLYSVPVIQTDDGETVQWERAEKIASCYDEVYEDEEILLCEPYLVYGEDENTLVRLNMDTGERKTFESPRQFHSSWYNFVDRDGYLYLVNEDEDESHIEYDSAVYRIRIDDWTSEKIYECENKKEGLSHLLVKGQFLYMAIITYKNESPYKDEYVFDRIECFDLEQKKTVGQFSVQEMERFVKKEILSGNVKESGELDYSELYIDELSTYAGRLYIMFHISLLTKEDVDTEDTDRIVFLSCSDKDMADLNIEQEMTEWIYDKSGDEVRGMGVYEDDSYYFRYVDEHYNRFLMRYHLDTKQIEEVNYG